MSTDTLIRAAMDAGVALKFEDGKLKALGHVDAVRAWAPRLREHKAELIEAIREASRTTHELLTVARLAAAHWGDNFEDWRRQCLEVPLHQRADLLAHLRSEYGGRP